MYTHVSGNQHQPPVVCLGHIVSLAVLTWMYDAIGGSSFDTGAASPIRDADGVMRGFPVRPRMSSLVSSATWRREGRRHGSMFVGSRCSVWNMDPVLLGNEARQLGYRLGGQSLRRLQGSSQKEQTLAAAPTRASREPGIIVCEGVMGGGGPLGAGW